MRAGLLAVLSGLLGLAGCSGGSFEVVKEAAAVGTQFQGVVHGGQQPVVGAKIFLLAANTTGYGGNGLAASVSNASVSLLGSAANTVQDTNSASPTYLDWYTTTGSDGSFVITGDYSCTPGTQVYLYALGGNSTYPAGSANPGIGLLAALGACPSADRFPSSTYIMVNEVSTIATAYAFAGFATDALHVSSSGTALAQTGIANAFANVANLETLSTGVALATTPAGNGTVPQSTINALADILAACVNTSGSASSTCSTLFTNALSAGATGIAATDTATAAINIAHYPGTNISALFALSTASPPFAPTLAAQPNDFTIGLSFTGGGLNGVGSIAIDGAGNAWIANYGGNSVTEFSPAGAALSPCCGFTGGYTGGGLSEPYAVAVDNSGNVWVANYGGQSVSKFSSTGVALSPSAGYTGGGLNYSNSIAIDGSGSVWLTNEIAVSNNLSDISKFSSAGVALSPSVGYNDGSEPIFSTVAIDGSGNAWFADFYNPGDLSAVTTAGTFLAAGQNGGLYFPASIAIDSSGNIWVPNANGVLSEFSHNGTAISPYYGYPGGWLVSTSGCRDRRHGQCVDCKLLWK